jgi:hypothetical protein
MQVQMPSMEEARVPSKSRIMVVIGTGDVWIRRSKDVKQATAKYRDPSLRSG